MNFEEMTIILERFISSYIPSGWKESISTCSFSPKFLPENVKQMYNSYKQKKLDDEIINYPWYIRKAINEFFERNYK